MSLGGTVFTNVALGLKHRAIRAEGTTEAATDEWWHDGRGWPTQLRYPGTSDSNVVTTYFYSDRGEVLAQADAAGRRTEMGYDNLGRPIAREVFEPGATVPLAWDYTYYNENGEVTWTDGPRYDPEDYVWRDYDGAGRRRSKSTGARGPKPMAAAWRPAPIRSLPTLPTSQGTTGCMPRPIAITIPLATSSASPIHGATIRSRFMMG